MTSPNELTGPIPCTLSEAAGFLNPAMSEEQLRGIIAHLPNFRPVGTQPTGGRPARLYDLPDVQELHNAVRRWL